MPNMHLRCGDIVDGCPFTTHASDERELLAKVAAHARDAHGLKEVPAELLAKVKQAIRTR